MALARRSVLEISIERKRHTGDELREGVTLAAGLTKKSATRLESQYQKLGVLCLPSLFLHHNKPTSAEECDTSSDIGLID